MISEPMRFEILASGLDARSLFANCIRSQEAVIVGDRAFAITDVVTGSDCTVKVHCRELIKGKVDGLDLPPIGAHVVVHDPEGLLMYGTGESGEVIAHVENTAVVRMSYGLGCFTAKHLRTKEQLAAEARESGARQICIDAMADPFDEPTESQMTVARRLYDKGYRIFEIVDEAKD